MSEGPQAGGQRLIKDKDDGDQNIQTGDVDPAFSDHAG
jgi:hypothetical protein